MPVFSRKTSGLLCVVVFCAVCAFVFVCGYGKLSSAAGDAKGAPKDEGASAVVVPVLVAKSTTSAVVHEYSGRLEAVRQAEVRARVAGIVMERTYQEGQEVKKGDVLFRIDPAPFKVAVDAAGAALARSQAELSAAVDKLKRHKELISERAVSERDYTEAVSEEQRAKANVASAKAELERAKLQLDYATVTAPISGMARRALVTEGALVGQNDVTHLTTVEQLDPIYAIFAQPSGEAMAQQKGIRQGSIRGIAQESAVVRLVLPDGSVYGRDGKLVFSDLSVDPSTDTITMRAEFANPDYELLPGSYVKVRLTTALRPGSFLVPRDALIRTSDTAMLMVVRDGKVTPCPVTAERPSGKNWVITHGLAEGDQIMISEVGMIPPGTPVRVDVRGHTMLSEKDRADLDGGLGDPDSAPEISGK